tara:strand:- start:2485 stop:2901 length:417 start_codon:yes stop_codon:yes gene_type:complete
MQSEKLKAEDLTPHFELFQTWKDAINNYIDIHRVHITPEDWRMLEEGHYRAARHGQGEIRDIWLSIFDLSEFAGINHAKEFNKLIDKGFSFAFVSLIQICVRQKIYGIHFHDMCYPIEALDHFKTDWDNSSHDIYFQS